MRLTVFDRCDTVLFPEGLSEIRLGGKAHGGGYGRNRVIRIGKKSAGGFHPALIQILDR